MWLQLEPQLILWLLCAWVELESNSVHYNAFCNRCRLLNLSVPLKRQRGFGRKNISSSFLQHRHPVGCTVLTHQTYSNDSSACVLNNSSKTCAPDDFNWVYSNWSQNKSTQVHFNSSPSPRNQPKNKRKRHDKGKKRYLCD